MSLHIISRSSGQFNDRRQAGHLLGHLLRHMHGDLVVVGIPRGGLIVAQEIALLLDAELDVVQSRKIRAPGTTDLAIGAVAEDGKVFLDTLLASSFGADDVYVHQEKTRLLRELLRTNEVYRRILSKTPFRAKNVIVTDDGVTTGATISAVLWKVRQEKPRKMIAALPVAPEDVVKKLTHEADLVVCLRTPPRFAAVEQFYREFETVSEETVLAILKNEKTRKVRHGYV